jgi:uncharacterized protein YndB with AHSA1/START domain
MRIDEYAPVVARREIGVAASPELVWDLLTAVDRWGDWNPDVKSASQPDLRAGAVFRWKAGPASLTSTLREVAPPRVLGWTGTTMGVRAVHVWRLRPDGDRTIARTEESMTGVLAQLLPGIMRRRLQKTLDTWLDHLKAEAEHRSWH